MAHWRLAELGPSGLGLEMARFDETGCSIFHSPATGELDSDRRLVSQRSSPTFITAESRADYAGSARSGDHKSGYAPL